MTYPCINAHNVQYIGYAVYGPTGDHTCKLCGQDQQGPAGTTSEEWEIVKYKELQTEGFFAGLMMDCFDFKKSTNVI